MSIGVCYFPEHWPHEQWETDIRQMADAGIEYVRMAEFSWGVLEPERGAFDFEWLDEIVGLVGEYGMEAVLCTPTAAPPRWLVEERPEIRQRDRDGTVRDVGSRRHYCFNSDAYREETERVVRAMAERYADDPRVVGWQTDNEYGCHGTTRCYCDDCADAFRNWVREEYETVDALNEAWGTTFWSQQYDDFEQVDLPRPTPAQDHPSMLLDFARFASDSVVEYNRLQANLLREANEEWFVTHNFMNLFESVDAYEFDEDLDLIAWDSYPTGHAQQAGGETTADELRAGNPDLLSFNHDLYRSVLDRPFWVMEQQPGDVNWPPHSAQPAEGAMRLWAHHATAHGADTVVYFRWRRCLEGQEQYHAGLRKQDGTADRGYADATRAAEELFDLDHVDAPVALLHDYENAWALGEQSHAPDFDYWQLLQSFYASLRAHGVQVDIVHPENDLESYDAVVAPTLHLATESLADHLTAYVESGGELLLGPRTGVKDEFNKLRPGLQPGPLSALVGASVDQHETLPTRFEPTVARPDETDAEYAFRTWAEWLEADAGEPLLEYAGDDIEGGRTAAVRNAVGEGSVVYCGVWPESELANDLVGSLLDRAGVPQTDVLPDGVRVASRDGHTWVMNFRSDPVAVTVAEDASWRLGGPEIDSFDLAIAEIDAVDELSVQIRE
ncbi:beta-galactosidase (plasmid) [Haloterrigena salifodinae]|uniref:beta-galactosidase n=1 Tax=Haloterrigena salifodinae TaxID=2675099 RepID=A0A8T8E8C4_9EURY|nr:beta-galactosidase [Haloterrigena salifodinae]QRV17790.1 beta-galactosidase [Haloterrigena salifodinae]